MSCARCDLSMGQTPSGALHPAPGRGLRAVRLLRDPEAARSRARFLSPLASLPCSRLYVSLRWSSLLPFSQASFKLGFPFPSFFVLCSRTVTSNGDGEFLD